MRARQLPAGNPPSHSPKAAHAASLPPPLQCDVVYASFMPTPPPPPVVPLHRLYVNLITAITMGMMLAAEPAEPDIMQRPPRRPGKRLLGKLILWWVPKRSAPAWGEAARVGLSTCLLQPRTHGTGQGVCAEARCGAGGAAAGGGDAHVLYSTSCPCCGWRRCSLALPAGVPAQAAASGQPGCGYRLIASNYSAPLPGAARSCPSCW
jgi:hypothetical protein